MSFRFSCFLVLTVALCSMVFAGHESPAPLLKPPGTSDTTPKGYYNLNGGTLFGGKFKFLGHFDPRIVNTRDQTNGKDLEAQLRPIHSSLPFNADQIIRSTHFHLERDFVAAANANADLGLQFTLREVLRKDTLVTKDENGKEYGALVILSHGHSIAGLAELAKMTTDKERSTETFLFDTTVYLPQGGWSDDAERVEIASEGAQMWGDSIEATKHDFRSRGVKGSGGFAVALNGHRGDPDQNGKTANIDPEKLFGTPKDLKTMLGKRGIRRVVIVTEAHVMDPSKVNRMPLEALTKGPDKQKSFDAANRDLFQYFSRLEKAGVEVLVVSGEQNRFE